MLSRVLLLGVGGGPTSCGQSRWLLLGLAAAMGHVAEG